MQGVMIVHCQYESDSWGSQRLLSFQSRHITGHNNSNSVNAHDFISSELEPGCNQCSDRTSSLPTPVADRIQRGQPT